jgi:hypothetical protein
VIAEFRNSGIEGFLNAECGIFQFRILDFGLLKTRIKEKAGLSIVGKIK